MEWGEQGEGLGPAEDGGHRDNTYSFLSSYKDSGGFLSPHCVRHLSSSLATVTDLKIQSPTV